MDVTIHLKDAFSYFRMGLVTGLVDRPALVDWADSEILRSPSPGHEIMELSLCGRRPYSQIIRLLSGFERGADYRLSLKLLFARAGLLLEAEPGRATDIIMGLRLLNEEEYFPGEIKARLIGLRADLELHRQAALSAEELTARLAGFLAPYSRPPDAAVRTRPDDEHGTVLSMICIMGGAKTLVYNVHSAPGHAADNLSGAIRQPRGDSMANAVVWFDVPTVDFDRAVKFYSDILGVPVRVDTFMGQKLGFFPMEGDGAGGDIVPPDPNYKPSSMGTRVYLNCDGKLDEVAGRVVKAGGKIIQPKFSIGEMGNIVMIADTEGNVVGLHSMK